MNDIQRLRAFAQSTIDAAMGLPHLGGDSVMRSGNTTIAPTADDEARLRSLWGDCGDSALEP